MSDVAPDEFPQQQIASESLSQGGYALGARLAAEREAKGWTMEYVAGQLNLAVRQIQALEAENYAALPGMASVRGFVRAYAKLLKVDADSLVALIASEQIVPNQPLEPKPNLSSTPFSHTRLSGNNRRGNSLKGAIFALVVIVLAVGAIAIEHLGGWPTLSQSLSAQFRDLSNNGSGNAGTPASSDDAPVSKPSSDGSDTGSATSGTTNDARNTNGSNAANEASVPVAQPESKLTPTPEPVPQASAPVDSAPTVQAPAPAQKEAPKPEPVKPVAASPAVAAAKPGGGTLVLTARQNSWVDVRAGNNVVASHLLKAGDTETIEVPGSAQLTVGNAAGVDATFRGQPLSTATDGKSTVAHISLK